MLFWLVFPSTAHTHSLFFALPLHSLPPPHSYSSTMAFTMALRTSIVRPIAVRKLAAAAPARAARAPLLAGPRRSARQGEWSGACFGWGGAMHQRS